MPQSSSKKVVLITGASSGIGKATALRLLQDGHIVYGAARRVKKMQDIEMIGGHAIEMDITKEEDIKNTVDIIIEKEGRIDVLFNNAGYGLYGPVEEVFMDDVRNQFEVNLFGLARLTQLVLPHMRAQGNGTIINTSSVGGKVYSPLGAWYYATKHALEGWSDTLRLEVKEFGVDVVIIEPGLIKTEFGDVMSAQLKKLDKKSAYKESIETMISLGEKSFADGSGSDPEVIVNLVLRAIKAKNPQTRYVAGKFSHLVLFMRHVLSDKMFDRLMMWQTKQMSEK